MIRKDKYRPEIHFTAPTNWINDPNGMVYVNGEYHLFYQYYPKAVHWGPMHWGHAVSEDLLHWTHLPIGLYPDELGTIFSGSCVLDVNNVSGFGEHVDPRHSDSPVIPPMIAVFTSHDLKTGQEQQSIAYSTDYVHFEKYYGNPVIPNTEKKDFRDPKVFWNPKKNCYSLVLAAGDHVEFYVSENLKDWTKSGEFKPVLHESRGICECPDCFPLMTPDGEKWVLIISMILPEDHVGVKDDVYDRMEHITEYFVGDFDGDTFHETENAEEAFLLDFGTDNYAAVTFQNLKEKVMIGWADNWQYAAQAPSGAEGFNGKMTLARKMSLVKTESGYRVAFAFEGLDFAKKAAAALENGENRLRSQVFGIKAVVKGEGSIVLANDQGEKIVLTLGEDEICLDRTNAGLKEFADDYEKDSFGVSRVARMTKGETELEIVFDRCLIEVLAENGLMPITASVFPQNPYETITVEGAIEAEIYPL